MGADDGGHDVKNGLRIVDPKNKRVKFEFFVIKPPATGKNKGFLFNLFYYFF